MAMAAVRALAVRRAQVKQRAKAKAHKLELEAKKLTDIDVDATDKHSVVDKLLSSESTRFLGFLVTENPAFKKDEEVELNAAKLKNENPPSTTSVVAPVFPSKRPMYMSQRHYDVLADYFSRPGMSNPGWLKAYIGHSDNRKVGPDDSVGGAEDDVDEEEAIDANNTKIPKNIFDNFVAREHDKSFRRRVSFSVRVEMPVISSEASASFRDKAIFRYNEFVCLNQMIVASKAFSNIVMVAIVTAGVLVGIQTYPQFSNNNTGLDSMNDLVQSIFTVDCAFKVLQEGRRPWEFWLGEHRDWNNFDFWLVVICFLPPSMVGGNVAFIRLLRLMRLFKLVGKVKRLQVIVVGLIKGLGSVTYIVLLLLLVFYLYACLGVSAFRRNDPFHFGGVATTMVTLFRFATLDNWAVAFMINYFGCDSQFDSIDAFYTGLNKGLKNSLFGTRFGSFYQNICWRPAANPITATLYFVSFVLIASFIILSLFIGAVCGGMSDSLEAFEAAERHEKMLRKQAEEAFKDPNSSTISALLDVYDVIDSDGSGDIDANEFLAAMKQFGQADMTMERVVKIIDSIHYGRDGSQIISKKEFVSIMSERTMTLYRGGDEEESATEAQRAVWEADVLVFLLRAWKLNFKELKLIEDADRQRPLRARYQKLADRAEALTETHVFKNLMTAVIVLAGILVGLETELEAPGAHPHPHTLNRLDAFVLYVFTFEVVVKLVATGFSPLSYFRDYWNLFDFFIVAACWFFKLPFLPSVGSLLSMLRLVRLLRVLKLVRAFPELRVIISALIAGFSSMSFVTIILFMFFYFFANIGILLFQRSDPRHFGNLQLALLNLFRSATGDGWSDLMYTVTFGCSNWQYSFGRHYTLNGKSEQTINNCNHPEAWGWIGIAYYISFCVLGMQVLLTLFIGVIATSMEDAKAKMAVEKAQEARVYERARILNIDLKPVFSAYESIFKYLDDGDGKISIDEFKKILPCLAKVRNEMHEAGLIQSSGKVLSRPDIQKLFYVFSCCDVHFQEDGLRFPEFLVALDFFRRAVFDPDLATSLRAAFEESHSAPREDALDKVAEMQREVATRNERAHHSRPRPADKPDAPAPQAVDEIEKSLLDVCNDLLERYADNKAGIDDLMHVIKERSRVLRQAQNLPNSYPSHANPIAQPIDDSLL